MNLVADAPSKWHQKEVDACKSVSFKILLYFGATFSREFVNIINLQEIAKDVCDRDVIFKQILEKKLKYDNMLVKEL